MIPHETHNKTADDLHGHYFCDRCGARWKLDEVGSQRTLIVSQVYYVNGPRFDDPCRGVIPKTIQ